MNVREMKLYARSLVRDSQMLDAHFLRWANRAYRELARTIVVPRLHVGTPVALTAVSGSTQRFYLPYDHVKVISFYDSTGRALDPIQNEDVRQFGEYNTFGSFVQFYEYTGVNDTPLLESGSTPYTVGISNRGTTATFSDAILTSDHEDEYLLPLARNSSASAGNPEDYAYKISSVDSTTEATISPAFRGVLSDSGTVGDLTTGYFEIRPKGTPMIRIWGDPGTSATIYCEYQKNPLKLANDEDIPEEPRLAEAIVHAAIRLGGLAYRQGFVVETAKGLIAESLSAFKTVADWDKQLIHNFITSNPNCRSYSQISGRHMNDGAVYDTNGIRY